MPISDDSEYAARTACRDHTVINTRPLRGSMRGMFLSKCELARWNYGCKYSHTIFNVDRVHKLGSHDGRTTYVVSFDYGHGFERYGGYEYFDSGWDVRILPDPPKGHVGRVKTRNLPKVLLAEEARVGLRKADDAQTEYAKVQSICQAHDKQDSACERPDCKFDHDLVDSARIEKLVWWPPIDSSDYYDAVTVECRLVEGQTTWKIVLKEAVFTKLKATDPIAQRIPSRPYSYESAKLLDVVRHMEQIVGLARNL